MILRRALVVALALALAVGVGQPLAAAPSLQDAISIGLFHQALRAPSLLASSVTFQSGLRPSRVFDQQAATRFLRTPVQREFELAQLAFGYRTSAPSLVATTRDLKLRRLGGSQALVLPLVIIPTDLGAADRFIATDAFSGQELGESLPVEASPQKRYAWNFTPITERTPLTATLPFHGVNLSLHLLGSSGVNYSDGAQRLQLGSLLNVQTPHARLNVNLQSNYQRITALTPQVLSVLPLNNPSLLAPGAVDFQQQTVGASIALPLKRGFSLGVSYGQTHLYGSYGGLAPIDLDARNSSYLGNLTYRLPHSSSAITLSAKRSFYQDNLVPTLVLPQANNDVNLTIKF